MGVPCICDLLPDFAAELKTILLRMGRVELAEQIDCLPIIARCSVVMRTAPISTPHPDPSSPTGLVMQMSCCQRKAASLSSTYSREPSLRLRFLIDQTSRAESMHTFRQRPVRSGSRGAVRPSGGALRRRATRYARRCSSAARTAGHSDLTIEKKIESRTTPSRAGLSALRIPSSAFLRNRSSYISSEICR